MYTTIDEALDAVERLRIRHCRDRDVARGMVAVWAGYEDWADLTRRIGTSTAIASAPAKDDQPAYMNYTPALLAYMEANGNPLIDDNRWKIMDYQLDALLSPHAVPIADAQTSDEVMRAVKAVLSASPRTPKWLDVRSVHCDAEGNVSIRVVQRHRDGVREAFMDIDASDVAEDLENAGDVGAAIARRYVIHNCDDTGAPPVSAVDVMEGRSDASYGVDVPTLRWAVERWGDDARKELRSHVIGRLGDRDGQPDHDTFSRVDTEEPDPEADGHYPRTNRYTVHLVDGVLRRAMRLGCGVVWDRAVHVADHLPDTAAVALVGQDAGALVAHPYLAGSTIVAVHEGLDHTVIELDQRIVTLDSVGPDEGMWRPFTPLPQALPETGLAMVEWDLDMADEISGTVLDSAVVNGIYYALSESRGVRSIEIVTASGKVMSDDDGPFATDCPRRIIDAADPARSTQAFFWRMRCLGLSDRNGDDTVYF